jgi:peroxiredoxin
MARFLSLAALSLLLTWFAPVDAQVIKITIGEPAQDFPPGPFTDGGQYKLSDFKGKVLVLYFFETNGNCQGCRTIIPERTALVHYFKGKPVKFVGVAANCTMPQALAFQQQTGLAMPVFVDSLGLMQARYGFQISLKNVYQTRSVGPTGKIEEVLDMDKEGIEKLVKKSGARFKYTFADYDPKLKPALEFLEYGNYTTALKALGPFSKSSTKAVSEGAKKLVGELRMEAEAWKADADDATAIEPLKAYDLYQKVVTRFHNDELGKSASAALKKLSADKSIAPELAARKAYLVLIQNMGQVTIGGRSAILQGCKSIIKKYPGTPTADKADDLYKELGGAGGK